MPYQWDQGVTWASDTLISVIVIGTDAGIWSYQEQNVDVVDT